MLVVFDVVVNDKEGRCGKSCVNDGHFPQPMVVDLAPAGQHEAAPDRFLGIVDLFCMVDFFALGFGARGGAFNFDRAVLDGVRANGRGRIAFDTAFAASFGAVRAHLGAGLVLPQQQASEQQEAVLAEVRQDSERIWSIENGARI